MVTSKLRERLKRKETEKVSKLKDRLPSSIEQRGAGTDISRFRQKTKSIKDWKLRKNEQERLYLAYKEAYTDYISAFDIYKKERKDYTDAISEWMSSDVRDKERAEFESAHEVLVNKANILKSATVNRFGKELDNFKEFREKLPEEKSTIKDIETKNIKRIKKLDVDTTKLLQPFKYYEGVGFATGDIKETDYSIVNGGGVGSHFYGAGEYQKYDISTGIITTYKANPQSNIQTALVKVNGEIIDPDQLDDINPTTTSEVIGEGFDFTKYKDNKNYDILRDESGNITEIKAKAIRYRSSSSGGQDQFSMMVPEVIKVKDGKVTSWTKYDHYTSYKSGDQKQRSVGATEIKQYDSHGLLTSLQRFSDKETYRKSDTSKMYPTLSESYIDGVKVKRRYSSWHDGSATTKEQNYLTGKEIYTDREGNQTIKDTSTTELLSGEAQENVRKYGALPNVDIDQSYRTAKEGEDIRKINIAHTDSQGKVYTVTVPAFNAPDVVKKREAFFGTKETAQKVLTSLPFEERESAAPLRQYKQIVYNRVAAERQVSALSRPGIILTNPETKKQFWIDRPKGDTLKSRASILANKEGLAWNNPGFISWEKSHSARMRDMQKNKSTIISRKIGGIIQPTKHKQTAWKFPKIL